mmetsp:Transcript_30095/g.70880  ORF Transcript_30095/g.70880 Transcript_30095/m.70880 type:complete len:101 (-) Transcript_30095:516-818(-)
MNRHAFLPLVTLQLMSLLQELLAALLYDWMSRSQCFCRCLDATCQNSQVPAFGTRQQVKAVSRLEILVSSSLLLQLYHMSFFASSFYNAVCLAQVGFGGP